MKKSIVFLVALALSIAIASPGSAVDSAITSVKKVTVNTSSGFAVRGAQGLPLANGNTLVSWVEEIDMDNTHLRTKLVSATNKVGKVQTLTSSSAFVSMIGDASPQLVVNKKGQLFAAWVQRTTKDNVVSEKVVGRTSTNVTTWSKLFDVTSTLPVTAEMCDDETNADCGFTKLQAAIDDTGRVGVLLGFSSSEGFIEYKVSATSNTANWPALKLLGSLETQMASEIVSLTSGFAVSYTDYLSNDTCSIKVALYDGETSEWGPTMIAKNLNENTVINSKWIQRSSKTLTLVISAQNFGGIDIKHYRLFTNTWAGSGRVARVGEESIVFQQIAVATKGWQIAIGYITYNQTNGVSQARILVQKTVTGSFTHKVLQSGEGGIHPVSAGFNKSGNAFFAYLLGGTQLATLSGSSTPKLLPGLVDIAQIQDLDVSDNDLVTALDLTDNNDQTTITLIKGKLK
jgi:hypothetical protein